MNLPTEASGSQARVEDMSEKKKRKEHKKSDNVELNMRRTELQLGLPGSPEEEEDNEFSQEGNDIEEHGGNDDGYSRKSENATGSNRFGQIRGATADAPTWHLRGGVGSSSSSSSCHIKQQRSEPDDCVEKHEDAARAPVGWPPVQSFRKNSLNVPNPSKSVDNTTSNPAPGTSSTAQQPVALHLVKVYMDGVPIGRKVNLRTHSSYERLSIALEEMFRRFISGQSGTSKAMKDKMNEGKKFNFIYGSDYVLTYEDKDGDLMLVGDVPWGMFVGTVKRLRIMKGSEAIGLAPRVAEERQAAAAK